MAVGRAELERSLVQLAAECEDPRAGLFGPASLAWEIGREAMLFLGGGRAALLQLAHPWVAQAVADHSVTLADARGRFVRTFENVFAMVFGDLEAALAAARRVHAIHERVRGRLDERAGPFAAGSPYLANDEQALYWVQATLDDTSIQVFELLVRPLSRAEKEEYLAETRRFARLFGIPDAVIPSDWEAFCAYNRRMWNSELLQVGTPARRIAEQLLQLGHPLVRPLMGWYRIMTAGLLPERLRAAYGLAFGPAERAVFAASVRLLRAGLRRLPGRLRYLPAYFEALARLRGSSRAGALDRAVRGALERAGRWVLAG
ncbi:MAG: hypothetical protein KatS3mg102_1294 [Planctomycetota bacterium]|nr:MAG: hypothetical protein KatS3mg102_1294 [Planctomycetota bacterium]